MAWILPSGKYYDASNYVAEGSIEVPVRPSDLYDWAGSWVLNTARQETRRTDAIKAQIIALEASKYMARDEREGWMALTVATAAAQGVNEATLYAANPFYKHTKDQNTQIVALRAQL